MNNNKIDIQNITNNMIAWAQERLGQAIYIGWCLSFVEDAIEESNNIEVFGGDSAKESYLLYRDAIRTDIPPRGSVVFYDILCHTPEGVMDWGHCGIAVSDGRIIHAWNQIREDDYLDVESLTSYGEHPKYLGWVPLERVLMQKPENE